jgi:glycosyltransferase involved in cell wall biosynthesis
VIGLGVSEVDVLLAAFRFHPVYAGPAIRFKRYATGFRERDVDLRVFSAHLEVDGQAGARRMGEGERLDPDVVDGIAVQRVHVSEAQPRLQLFRYYRALARYLEVIPRRPDVVQLLTLTPWASPWYRKIRRMGVPLVYTSTMMPTPGLAWYKRRLDRIPLRWLDCVVVSTGVMRDAMGGATSRLRVEVIPNGLDLERFQPVDSEEQRRTIRDRLGLDPAAELLLFLGGVLNHRKGVDVLADAWPRVAAERPAARLVLVGPQADELKPQGPQAAFLEGVRRSLASAPGGLDRVVFTGPVDNVQDYLRAADVFVFPSRKEGMPNAVPEAFGCGLASVLTAFEGLPEEFGRPGEQYVLSPRTPEGLSKAVIGLLESPDRRRALGGAARAWVEANLGVDRSLDRYAELYRELSERSKARSR